MGYSKGQPRSIFDYYEPRGLAEQALRLLKFLNAPEPTADREHLREVVQQFTAARIAYKRSGRRTEMLPFDYGVNIREITRNIEEKPELGMCLLFLFRLESAGKFLRIRQCEQCTIWFYGRQDNQIFCSSPCKQKAHRSSSEYMAKRRQQMKLYMRKYRAQNYNAVKRSTGD